MANAQQQEDAEPATVVVWTDDARSALVQQVLDLMGSAVSPIGVGGPRGTAVEALADTLDCTLEDDFRQLMVERRVSCVLLATMTGATASDALLWASAGVAVLALEPICATLEELADATAAVIGRQAITASGPVALAPGFEHCPGWTGAADPTQVLNSPQLIGFTTTGPATSASLFARLYSAWRVVLTIGVDLPASIDASLIGPAGSLPDDLRGVSGSLAAHARAGRGEREWSAVVEVGDQIGPGFRQLRLIGAAGRLLVHDHGYELYDQQGKPLDAQPAAVQSATDADLIAEHWRRRLDQSSPRPATSIPDDAAVLACCLACLLSARTGQPESPAKLLQVQGRR